MTSRDAADRDTLPALPWRHETNTIDTQTEGIHRMTSTLTRRPETTATSPAGSVATITKRCPRCTKREGREITKPATEFNRASARPDGLQSVCRPCQGEQERESRARRAERDRALLTASASGAPSPAPLELPTDPPTTPDDADETSADGESSRRRMRRKECETCHETKALKAYDHGAGLHGRVDTCRACRGYGAGAPVAEPADDEATDAPEHADRNGFAAITLRAEHATLERIAERKGDVELRAEARGIARAYDLLVGEPIAPELEA